jgi:MoaA/NifB/PqqE/SkfB family radical SAM enzyme
MTAVARQGTSHGWAHLADQRKRELIDAVRSGRTNGGPLHAELDLTDRCNVVCYFCNQQDTRSKLQIPLERTVALIDEMAENGLASVRLSGGGDPLHHKQILDILDHLAERGVVLDNLTTNAVSMSPEVIERLVRHRAREVNVSLNTCDAADYQRMMQVKPAIFDKVLANVRALVTHRGDRPEPLVSIQYLLDRGNAHRAAEMAELALGLGADRTILSAVSQIDEQRLDDSRLLHADDAERLLPAFEELFRRYPDQDRLEVNLGWRGLDGMVAEARRRAAVPASTPFPIAPSFRGEDGGCFFAWYSTAITGNGNVYPCCQLIRPAGPVLGNVLEEGDFAGVWGGDRYRRLRGEMREVLLDGAETVQPAGRFEILPTVCHEPGMCWLKNVYFRADESFYQELGEALDAERAARARVRGRKDGATQLVSRFPRLVPLYDRLRNGSRPLRRWLKRRLGLDLTEAA